MGAQDPEQHKEPTYQVTYHSYLSSGEWLSYTPSVEHAVGWNNAQDAACYEKFRYFPITSCSREKRYPFSILPAMEIWAGPENEATALSLCYYMYMWQSRIEIEYYSVAYFERIAEFDML